MIDSMPKDSSIPGRQCVGQYASFGDVPGVGGMPNIGGMLDVGSMPNIGGMADVGAIPKGSTVDVPCGGAMPQALTSGLRDVNSCDRWPSEVDQRGC